MSKKGGGSSKGPGGGQRQMHVRLKTARKHRPSSQRWLERHDEFHDRLCRAADRPQLEVECRRYRLAVRPYVRLYLKSGRTFEQPGFGHEALIEALRSGDGARAEAAARAHILANAEAIAECLPDVKERASASAA